MKMKDIVVNPIVIVKVVRIMIINSLLMFRNLVGATACSGMLSAALNDDLLTLKSILRMPGIIQCG